MMILYYYYLIIIELVDGKFLPKKKINYGEKSEWGRYGLI